MGAGVLIQTMRGMYTTNGGVYTTIIERLCVLPIGSTHILVHIYTTKDSRVCVYYQWADIPM